MVSASGPVAAFWSFWALRGKTKHAMVWRFMSGQALN